MYSDTVLHAKSRRASVQMGFAETKDKVPQPVVGSVSIPMLAINIYGTSLQLLRGRNGESGRITDLSVRISAFKYVSYLEKSSSAVKATKYIKREN